MEGSLYPKISNITAVIYEHGHTHFHNSMEGYNMMSFGYIISGSVLIETDSTSFPLASGDLFAVSPRCRYKSHWIGDPDVRFYALHLLPEPDAEFFTFPVQKIAALSIPETGRRFLEIIRLVDAAGYADRMRALSLFCGFYADAVPHITDIAMHHLNPSLVSAMRYIDRHYREECTIETLCEVSFVSPPHLYYLFRKELDTTPIHYRNRIRIEKCAEELRSTEREEIDIAEAHGFSSLSYFRECFRRQIGMTPYQYRNLARQESAHT